MKLRLSTKTLFALAGIIIVTIVSSMVALGYAWKMRQTMENSLSKNAMEMLAAAELDIALLKQGEIIQRHMLAPDAQEWSDESKRVESIFRITLQGFEERTTDSEEKALLVELNAAFSRYDALRDTILGMEQNDIAKARHLVLHDLDTLYHDCSKICDTLVDSNKRDIISALHRGEMEYRHFKEVVVVSILLIGVLGFSLTWLLFRSLFIPLRRMTQTMEEGIAMNGSLVVGATHQDDLETLASGLRIFMTEIAETRSDLELKQHELSQAHRLSAIGNIVVQVAHEIKNRLVMLGGFALSIEKDADAADKVRKKASIISLEVAKLERMLKGITDFSKPIHLELETHSLNDFLEELMPKLAEFTPQNITINLRLHPQPLQVRMDAERMEQVIVNLVKNAVEAMQTAGAGCSIMVSTSLHDKGVAINITNDGPGMDDEIQKHVFEPFFTTKKQGTGLGLAISKKIVLDHGGDMQCKSSPNQGTTFTIICPLA